MNQDATFKHEFVKCIPGKLEERTLYVSVEYATAVHLCACGCGHEVVTPLSPTDWRITFDGVSASLHPSIGNWGFPCQSHYWIDSNAVKWAGPWSKEQIAGARAWDQRATKSYYEGGRSSEDHGEQPPAGEATDAKRGGFWWWLTRWLGS